MPIFTNGKNRIILIFSDPPLHFSSLRLKIQKLGQDTQINQNSATIMLCDLRQATLHRINIPGTDFLKATVRRSRDYTWFPYYLKKKKSVHSPVSVEIHTYMSPK